MQINPFITTLLPFNKVKGHIPLMLMKFVVQRFQFLSCMDKTWDVSCMIFFTEMKDCLLSYYSSILSDTEVQNCTHHGISWAICILKSAPHFVSHVIYSSTCTAGSSGVAREVQMVPDASVDGLAPLLAKMFKTWIISAYCIISCRMWWKKLCCNVSVLPKGIEKKLSRVGQCYKVGDPLWLPTH